MLAVAPRNVEDTEAMQTALAGPVNHERLGRNIQARRRPEYPVISVLIYISAHLY